MSFERTIHLDAPVKVVFDLFANPADWQQYAGRGITYRNVNRARDGVGTTYEWTARLAGIPISGRNTYTEFVQNRHITDRCSRAFEGTWTYSFAPDGSGTALTYANEPASFWRVPPLRRLLDRATASTHEPVMARLQADLAGRRTVHRERIMRRTVVAGTIAAALAAAGAVLRRRAKAHWAEGTLPGRSGSWINSYLNRPSYRLIAARLALTPEDEVLDVACGSGEFLAVHAAHARRAVGIDRSAEKVALARERLAERVAAGTGEVVRGDAAAMPWADGAFTAVACNDAFPFFPDPDRVLAEMLRVLRPGGRLVVQIGMRWPHGIPKHMPHPLAHFDVADEAAVRKLVEGAGFDDVSISYGPVGGDSRLGNAVSRRLGGSDELRLVRGTKPVDGVGDHHPAGH